MTKEEYNEYLHWVKRNGWYSFESDVFNTARVVTTYVIYTMPAVGIPLSGYLPFEPVIAVNRAAMEMNMGIDGFPQARLQDEEWFFSFADMIEAASMEYQTLRAGGKFEGDMLSYANRIPEKFLPYARERFAQKRFHL